MAVPSTTKPHIQFSKKVVVTVCIAVTAISLLCILFDLLHGQTSQATSVMKVYIEYAMIVFIAYSGNSALEKWVLAKKDSLLSTTKTDEQEDDDDSVSDEETEG